MRKWRKPSRQVKQVPYRLTPIAVIRHFTKQNALDVRLEPTDWHLQRWAGGQGTGLPIDPEQMDDTPPRASRMPPLVPEIAILTDQVILESPGCWQRFIQLWYRTPKPAEVIAEELGLSSRQAVYAERKLVLAYFLGRFTEAGIPIASYRLRAALTYARA